MDALSEYKKISIAICASLQNELYENLKYMFDARGQVIDYMKTLEYTKEEFREIYNGLGIGAADEQLKELMEQKRQLLKSGIGDISKGLSVKKSYAYKSYADSYYFNKKL